MQLTNKVYDFLNHLVRYVLPGSGTLYFTVGQIWGLPYTTEVVGTIAAIATFLGVVIGVSRNGYEGDDTLLVQDLGKRGVGFGFESGRFIEDLPKRMTLNVKRVEPDEEL